MPPAEELPLPASSSFTAVRVSGLGVADVGGDVPGFRRMAGVAPSPVVVAGAGAVRPVVMAPPTAWWRRPIGLCRRLGRQPDWLGRARSWAEGGRWVDALVTR